VGVGLTAGAASALPAKLFDAVKSFPGAPAAASHAVAVLARGITEGVAMRVKLTAAAVVAAAIGLTGGAVLLSKADAQPPGGAKEDRRPGGGAGGAPPDRDPRPGAPVTRPAPGGEGGAPGMPGGPGGFGPGGFGVAVAPAQWEYKFVDIKSDRKEFEKAIVQHGKDGWEYAGSERFGGPAWNTGAGATPADLTLVFKKRVGGPVFGGMGGPPAGVGGGGLGGRAGGGAIEIEVGGNNPLGAGVWGQWGGKDGVEVRSFNLKNATAADVAAVLTKTLPRALKAVVPEPASNRLLVVADSAAVKDVVKLIEELEAKPGRGSGGTGAPGPMGPPAGTPRITPDRVPGGAPMGVGAGGPPQAAGGLTLITLKHAAAGETATLLKRVFPSAEVTADDRTNQLIVRADPRTLEELQTLLTKLDVPVTRK
jgi:hypothetical protein